MFWLVKGFGLRFLFCLGLVPRLDEKGKGFGFRFGLLPHPPQKFILEGLDVVHLLQVQSSSFFGDGFLVPHSPQNFSLEGLVAGSGYAN